MIQLESRSVLDVDVSFFDYCVSVTPSTRKLKDLLTSGDFKDRVEAVRGIADKNEGDKVKKTLPAFTPSGVFSERKATGLLSHSGLIGIDIDAKYNNDFEPSYLKKIICSFQNVAYCGLSVSGKGLWCIIPVSFPEKHKLHFQALEEAFKKKGIVIDSACKDVSRLRIVSYDPEPYFNHAAKKFFITSTSATPATLPSVASLKSATDSEKEVAEAIVELEKRSIDITEGYKAWFDIGCSLAAGLGERGREFFHRVSRLNPSYSFREAESQFDACLKAGYSYTLGTFFHYCKMVD